MIKLTTSTMVMKGAPYTGAVEFEFELDARWGLNSRITVRFTFQDKTYLLHTFKAQEGKQVLAFYEWKWKNQSYDTMEFSSPGTLNSDVIDKILNYMATEDFLRLIRKRVRAAQKEMAIAYGKI